IEYSSQGGKKDGMQALPTPVEIAQFFQSQNQQAPPYLYANYKSEAKMNYLMIPILAKFGWNLGHQNHWRIYVDAGPFAGFLLSAHQVESGGQSTLYLDANGTQPIVNPQTEQPIQGNFDTTTNIKSDLHHFNFGLEGNAGIACKINKKNTIFLEGGANYGFLNIQKGTANGKNNTGAGTVTLGYAYCLGKK
ncbi:MAG TPA: outer membrane beta-barrel protein, partial [Chitinophagaceae bacterium]|nr:outer membrane beta-barrel protein [Chitinophagaceae bacterium]